VEISNLITTPNPLGGQIDISWQLNLREEAVHIKLIRNDKDFPNTSDKGTEVYDSKTFECDSEDRLVQQLEEEMAETTSYSKDNVLLKRACNYFALDSGKFNRAMITIFDLGLKEEKGYYYSLFLREDGVFKTNPRLQITAFSTSTYNYSEQLYDHLPGIYKKYDKEGELKKFLEIFGYLFDLLRSHTRILRDLYDIDKCPTDFLSLLSQHIGWETNYSQGTPTQRNILKGAVQIYKKTGTLKAIKAYVHSLTGWRCRAREFVHNIFMSNAPEEMYFDLDGRCIVSRSKTVDISGNEYPDKDNLENLKTYKDTLHHTFDTERKKEDWYSNDTIGLFIIDTPTTAGLKRLEDSLSTFLPINVRALIITGGIKEDVFKESLDLVGKSTDTIADTLI